MNVELMLKATEPSLLIIEQRRRKDIVIGVPHHAPGGNANLPCPEHTDADENAGFLGRYVAEKLGCCSIIACNYTLDVNKSLHSDYATQIKRWNPSVLVEVHGHGAARARSDVEISSGSSAKNTSSTALANKLTSLLANSEDLKRLSICGDYGGIYFKASSSVTITSRDWLAYHIELPPKLRKATVDGITVVPKVAHEFCDALVVALEEMHGKDRSQA